MINFAETMVQCETKEQVEIVLKYFFDKGWKWRTGNDLFRPSRKHYLLGIEFDYEEKRWVIVWASFDSKNEKRISFKEFLGSLKKKFIEVEE